jgi:K+-sensing histidine kinase KdpD
LPLVRIRLLPGSAAAPDAARRRKAVQYLSSSMWLSSDRLWPYLWSAVAVALATLAGVAMSSVVPLPNVSMVFLLAVVFAAARFGIWPALLASGLSFLNYNFFFIEPFHTFTVAQPEELLALVSFLAIAILTSALAGRAKDEATKAARLAEEIVTARTAAETERVRNTLLASISHDFRTPLASILGAATGLIEYGARLPNAARADLLGQIKDEAEHLDGMVRNLLAITRVEAGALEINRDWLDVRELLHRVVAMAKRHGASQSFDVAVDSDLPFIAADQNLLDQALTNMVSNATRHAGAAAHILIEARRHADEIVVSVTDDGPGIDAKVLPHVFERFVRASSGGDAGEGTGLGLAIVKGIVEAHGGSVAAQSPVRDGHGTRILMRLRLEREQPQ